MLRSDSENPGEFLNDLKTRAPLLAAATLLVALILGSAIYTLRPEVDARAVIRVGDGPLAKVIPEIIPDFPYTPPKANDALVWFDAETIPPNQTITADGHELTILARDQDPSRAAADALRTADNIIDVLANYRPELLRSIMAWFDNEFERLEAASVASPENREQRLFSLLENALIDAKAKARTRYALLENQGKRLDVALDGDGLDGGIARSGRVLGGVMPKRDMLMASQTYRSLNADLEKLRAISSGDAFGLGSWQALRSTIAERKATLIESEAWSQPFVRLEGSVITSEPPFWARPLTLIPASLLLALIGTLGFALLHHVFTRGDSEDEDIDPYRETRSHRQMFSDPHWPAQAPQSAAAMVSQGKPRF